MIISLTILMILSSYPDGRASVAALKTDLAFLTTSDWYAKMRALSAHVEKINIFSDGLVVRDPTGWTITRAGREFLQGLEHRPRPHSESLALNRALSTSEEMYVQRFERISNSGTALREDRSEKR